MKSVLFLLLLIPIVGKSQTKSYHQAWLDCEKETEEMNKKMNQVSSGAFPYCLLGCKIPNFEATTTDNHKINSSYFIGKVTVLNFWLTTCPPCIAEIPGLNNIKDKYKDQKVNFLAIGKNLDKDKNEFLKIHPWNFDQIKNGQEVIDSVFKIKWGYPTTLIIDKHMKIIQVFHGGFHDARAAEDIQNKIIPILEKELTK